MKRYAGFSGADAELLASLAPIIEPHLPALADRFYEQIPQHQAARVVFTGGDRQIARLKQTLQQWARGLFSGVYDEAYAQERFRIGHRHVQIGLPQRYAIAAISVVEQFLRDVIDREVHDATRRRLAHESLSRIINLDLNLICETYFEGSLRELRILNDSLAATNDALARASRAKTEFLATVSHELRTPLTSIIGFSRLLAREGVADPATEREFARDIHASSLALLSLVDEILDVARIETGKLEVERERVDLRTLVDEVVGVVRLDADRRGLTLAVDVGLSLPAAQGDRARLRQVLLNILGNAVKFTTEGRVSVTARADEGTERLTIVVQDTGIGIAPEHQPALFEKFRQVDASYTRRHGGLGLGLAISKALVEKMGGAIALQSEGIGKGTTVTMTLPLAGQGVAEPRPAARAALRRPTVVVVAEEPRVRKRIAATLIDHGYAVKEGATADGTRAMIQAGVPDVLLLDLTGMSGPDAVREWVELLVALKSDSATQAIEVLVLSDGVPDRLTTLHFDLVAAHSTIVPKPVDADGLQIALRRIGQKHSGVCRVLIAEDDPLVFRFVQRLLPSSQYSIEHAHSGTEALAVLQTRVFDVLLLDLRMPDGSGYDVLRELTLEGRQPNLQVIVITNFPQPDTEEERALLGLRLVVDLLPKTAVAEHPELLLERLERIRSAQ